MVKINEHNIFTFLTRGSILLILIFSCAGMLFHSFRFGWSVIAGGMLAILNFYWLRNVLQRTLISPQKNALLFVQLRYLLRLGILGFVIYLLLVFAKANVFGLLLGLSVLVINIVAFSIKMSTFQGG